MITKPSGALLFGRVEIPISLPGFNVDTSDEAFAMVRIGEQEFLIGDGGDCWLLYAKVAGVILLEAPLLLLKDVDHLDPDAESD